MKKKRVFLSCGCLMMLLSIALASTNSAKVKPRLDSCPVIMIACLSNEPCCGPKYTFTANISGGYADREPTYKWSVSAGTITSGQGTGSVEVDASKINGQPLKVTVEVGNVIPDGCPTTESYTTECSKPSNVLSRARHCKGKQKN
jgi:hypothetical protein